MKRLVLFHIETKEEIPIQEEVEVIIGRGPTLKCEDNRISRKHGIIKVPTDLPETVHITSTHVNPIFYTTTNQSVNILTKDLSVSLKHGDKFALLPDQYWYQIKFKELQNEAEPVNDVEQQPIPSIRVKSVDELSSSSSRSLPSWMIETSNKRKNDSQGDVTSDKRLRVEEDKENQPEPNLPEEIPLIEENMENLAEPTLAEVEESFVRDRSVTPDIDFNAIPSSSSNNEQNSPIAVTTDLSAITQIRDPGRVDIQIPDQTPSSSVQIKKEDDEPSTSGGNKAVKVEADSSLLKESCKFGIKCYRKNIEHRTEFAHPGDIDYRRPNFPQAPNYAPECPFGTSCYRRNPDHFIQFKHPDPTTSRVPAAAVLPSAILPAAIATVPMPNQRTLRIIEFDSSEEDNELFDQELSDDSDIYIPNDEESEDDENDILGDGDGIEDEE